MAGLVPAIHVLEKNKAWMPGTRPGMTVLAVKFQHVEADVAVHHINKPA
jgi:hypothetical protein